jgi:hypothetical protein
MPAVKKCSNSQISMHQFEPFGGIIPDTVKGRVLAEIVADPFSEYTPGMMGELTDNHPRYANKALQELAEVGVVRKKETRGRQPVYEACMGSRKMTALTFLALAVVDDEKDQSCMDDAICEYVKHLGFKIFKDVEIGVRAIGPDGDSYTFIARSSEDFPGGATDGTE